MGAGEECTTAADGVAAGLVRTRSDLVLRLAELTAAFEHLVAATAGSNVDDEHDPEGATIAFERAQVDAAVRGVRTHLAEVDAALDRVAAGTYGVCEGCGGPIAPGRLEARPVARTCIACASR